MRIRYLEIRFRGIKSLIWAVTGDFNCIIGSGDACKTTILTALDFVDCRRKIEKSPLAQIEMSLSPVFDSDGEVAADDGDIDEPFRDRSEPRRQQAE